MGTDEQDEFEKKDQEPTSTKPDEPKKTKSKNAEEKLSFSQVVSNTWNDYKGEFRKIIWPSRKELIKKTVTVVCVSFIFAVIIFAMDSVYNLGVQLFVQYVPK